MWFLNRIFNQKYYYVIRQIRSGLIIIIRERNYLSILNNKSTIVKTLHRLLIAVVCLTIIFTLSHCSNDDIAGLIDDLEDGIDINDPNALTDAVHIINACQLRPIPTPEYATIEHVAGDLPIPLNDPEAPDLEGNIDPGFKVDVITSQGGSPEIEVNLSSGDIAGVYLQFTGADSYFDIPESALIGSHNSDDHEHTSGSIRIDLPPNIQPGTFCVDYCVYDFEGLVSNWVTICVEVAEIGGDNSDFLVGEWHLISFTETYHHGTQTIVIGTDTFEDSHHMLIQCADGRSKEVEVIETAFFDFKRFTFSEGGVLRFEATYTESHFDSKNSTCENLEYENESGVDDIGGVWSYEDAISRLILFIAFDDEVVEEAGKGEEALDLTISVDGNILTAIQNTDGSSQTLIFEKQSHTS